MDNKKLIEIFEDADYNPRSYSGRGMFGCQCLGVECKDPTRMILDVIISCCGMAESVSDVADFCEELKRSNTDNMGLDMIVYWPGIKWEEKEEEEDD